MKIAAGSIIAAAVAVVAGTASAQTTTYQQQYQQAPAYQTQPQTQTYQQAPAYGAQDGTVTYGTLPNTGTTTYQQPQQPGYQQPSFPTPQPYFPGAQQPQFPGFPGVQPQPFPGFPAPPANPAPAPDRNEVADTDAWTYSVARYYPAIKACLRNAKVTNPVVANIQERRNATVMLIGQGGTAEYQICRTGLNGTRIREGSSERGLPPAFYAPLASTFTITPDRPFQPVVDTGQRLVGWIVRTQPVRLDGFGGGRGFDGQFIKPVTVNTDAG